MSMCDHVSFLCIAYIMRLTPFDFIAVKWSNSNIFNVLYALVGALLGSMDANDQEIDEGTTLHQHLKLIQSYLHEGSSQSS